jgi:hypothetical protein
VIEKAGAGESDRGGDEVRQKAERGAERRDATRSTPRMDKASRHSKEGYVRRHGEVRRPIARISNHVWRHSNDEPGTSATHTHVHKLDRTQHPKIPQPTLAASAVHIIDEATGVQSVRRECHPAYAPLFENPEFTFTFVFVFIFAMALALSIDSLNSKLAQLCSSSRRELGLGSRECWSGGFSLIVGWERW